MKRLCFYKLFVGLCLVWVLPVTVLYVACGRVKTAECPKAWMHPVDQGWEAQLVGEALNDWRQRISLSGANPVLVRDYMASLQRAVVDEGLAGPALVAYADSLATAVGLTRTSALQVFDDVDLVDSNYVSRNVSLALHAFWAADWRDSVLLEVFREFVLPYKLAYELPDNWRDTLYKSHLALVEEQPNMADLDSLYAHHMVRSYYGLSSGDAMNALYPSEPNFSWLALSGEGDCVSRCRNVLYHLRAAGAPAAYDYVPCWGNRPAARHAYVGLAHRKRQLKNLLRNDNDPANLVNDLNAAAFTGRIHVFEKDDLPNGWEVQYEKTLPKMYRETWSAQPAMMALLEDVPLDELDLGLIKPNMQDVTSQYLKARDVELRRPFLWNNKMGYLAVFDVDGWRPVAFARFSWFGKAVFEAVGPNVLYLPMVKEQTRLRAFGDPFVLNADGSRRVFRPDYDSLVSLHLVRKYPLFINSAIHSLNFKGSVIEGANKPGFEDAKMLHTLVEYPFGMHRVRIAEKDSFRYLRLRSLENQAFRIAQLECFTEDGTELIKLENTAYTSGLLKGNDAKAFDGDLSSYMVRTGAAFDFGRPQKVAEVRICPRSDTNFIIPDKDYELLYWDGEWLSLGVKRAGDYFLDFDDVPSGAVYWLRCLTEGREERIFTWEQEGQQWW